MTHARTTVPPPLSEQCWAARARVTRALCLSAELGVSSVGPSLCAETAPNQQITACFTFTHCGPTSQSQQLSLREFNSNFSVAVISGIKVLNVNKCHCIKISFL